MPRCEAFSDTVSADFLEFLFAKKDGGLGDGVSSRPAIELSKVPVLL